MCIEHLDPLFEPRILVCDMTKCLKDDIVRIVALALAAVCGMGGEGFARNYDVE